MSAKDGRPKEERRRQTETSASHDSRARNRKDLQMLLRQQYERSEHCDLTLKVNDDKVAAHWCILAGNSAYFRNMAPRDVSPGPEELDLSDKIQSIRPVTTVLEFLYTGHIQIEKDEVEELLQVARLFSIKRVEELCIRYLLKNLCLSTCLWIWGISFDFSIAEVEDIARNVAVSRFHDTLINSTEALNIQPTHLLHFLTRGLGKFCTKEKMKAFIQRWYEKHKCEREQYIHQLEQLIDLPKNDSKGQDAENTKTLLEVKNTESEETKQERIEEAFVHLNSRTNNLLIYRPEKQIWLDVVIPKKHIQLDEYYPPLIGLGPTADLVCFKVKERLKLFNISTKQINDIPVWNKDFHLGSGESLQCCIPFHFGFSGVLYAGRELIYLEKKETAKTKTNKKNAPWYEGLRGMYVTTNIRMRKLCIDRFNIEKQKWELVCESKAVPGGAFLKVRTTARKDGSGYIVCVREPLQLLLYHLTPDGQLKHLASPAAHIVSRECLDDVQHLEYIYLFGTADQLFVKLRNNALVYMIQENRWEVQKFPKEHPSTVSETDVSRSHYGRDGDIYLSFKPIRSVFFEIGIHSPFLDRYTEVPPAPSYYMPTDALTSLVKSSFLDRLDEASLGDNMDVCFLDQRGIRRILKRVRRGWKEQDSEGEDAEGMSGSDEEDYLQILEIDPWLSGVMKKDWFQRAKIPSNLF